MIERSPQNEYAPCGSFLLIHPYLTTTHLREAERPPAISLISYIPEQRSEPSKYSEYIFGQARDEIKRMVSNMNGLLKYWRDEAAHDLASEISEAEAFISLGMLLRVAMHVRRYWNEITVR